MADIRLPDGTIIRNMPDNITRAELVEKLRRAGHDTVSMGLEEAPAQSAVQRQNVPQIASPSLAEQATQAAQQANPLQRFLMGGESGLARAAYGLKGLATDLSPEEREALAGYQAYQQAGGIPAAAGQFAAQTGMTAPFFGGAGLIGRAVPALGGALGQIPLGAAAGGLAGGLMEPEDRTGAALAGGIGGAAGAALGQTLRGLFRPKTEAARELAKRGVRLTPGQASGGIPRLAERAGLAPGAQERAIGDWNRVLIQDAAKATGVKITKSGPQGFEQAREAFRKAYDAVDNVPVKRDPVAGNQINSIISASEQEVVATKTLRQVADRVQQLINRPQLTLGALRTKSRDLRSMASNAKDPALGRAFRSMAEALDGIRERSGAASPALDAGYKRFLILEEAAKKGREDVFSVSHLRNAVRTASETSAFAEGRAPFAAEIRAAEGVFGTSLPADPGLRQGFTGMAGLGVASGLGAASGMPGGVFLAPALGVGVPMAAYTGPGIRFLTGQAPGQALVNPGLMGAAGAAGTQGLLGQ